MNDDQISQLENNNAELNGLCDAYSAKEYALRDQNARLREALEAVRKYDLARLELDGPDYLRNDGYREEVHALVVSALASRDSNHD